MSSISLDLMGKVISFEVYPVAKLGDKFKAVRVEGFLDYTTAKLYEDIDALAVAVYPSLPEGTPRDYKHYQYVKVRHSNDAVSIIAVPWINSDTLKINKETVVHVRLVLDHANSVEVLRKNLVANGFSNFEITFE